MIDKRFDHVFLARLALTMEAVEHELWGAADPGMTGMVEDEAIYIAYQERGGNPLAAKAQLAAARKGCVAAFGRILQFISDQYGYGAVESLPDPILKELTRDGYEAAENWLERDEAPDAPEAPDNLLRILLNTHCQLEEAKRAMHDELLWPIARRIFPKN